ncbi:MAG TPA: crosslink repair DNA glycosylase YcaQ family protein [Gaiellaceae bacterium]|nr:crosslink repair DNA glycosylase YcaQ family protein [Gaiellaceae bacterium]
MGRTPLEVTRPQVLDFRRRAGALDRRLAPGPRSLRAAAWAGLQDSMPRAAALSLHARVEGAKPSTWEDPSLVQVWGPRYHVYVVAARDLPVFTLGRLPDAGRTRETAEELAARLHALLGGRRMPYGDAGDALGVNPNALRYAALTGTLAIRWEGARQPAVWTVPPAGIDPAEATRELARRFLHVFGPSGPAAFARWAGIAARKAATVFRELEGELVPVRTPSGDACLLARDEAALREPSAPATGVRLLPSGDAYTLGVTSEERALLVPAAARRGDLWTPRVWPGALLVAGEVAGTWRRAGRAVTVTTWRRLSRGEREAVVAEAESLPLPDVSGRIAVDVR